jgi:predicted O-methyltransferase YrrM
MDVRTDFAKRLGWYAVVRIVKPEVVVETGVDKGLGTLILAAAVLRNGKGQVIGTDINPQAGQMLSGRYRDVARVVIGDSIETLSSLERIDVFINDSDHSVDYERREYEVIEQKLSENGIVLGDNAHVEVVLMEWAEKTGRQFLFWKEEPLHHWYSGAGIGFAFRSREAGIKPVD